jgi:succinylglutamic semialdehyde dehydrogenase
MSVIFKGHYVGGRFVRPSRGIELISEDPGDLLNPVGRLFVAPQWVDDAVAAALKAFPLWQKTPLSQRIARMRAFSREIQKRRSALVHLIAREAGKPIWEATRELDRTVAKVEEMIRWGLALVRPFDVRIDRSVTGECYWRPLGVLAVIGPFNFPAHIPASQIIPALLTGNTVVFKPSEYTPFVGQMLAECFHAAGFPSGVFNLVQGGQTVGSQLVTHPHVSGILFTGSTATGRAIQRAILDQPYKCLVLEMGGKNAAWVMADADLELAAREIVVSAYSMAGQRCNATSRILLDRKVAKAFLDRFLEWADRLKIGYPLEPGTFIGPLIGHEAVAKFQRAMEQAKMEGFEVLREGRPLGQCGKRRGYYVTAGVHLCENPFGVRRSKATAQAASSDRPISGGFSYRSDEIFGPDVAIHLVQNEEEAIRLNNEVPYGLITSVFTRSEKRFRDWLPRLDTGMVNWNRGTIFSSGRLPFGGTKASGSFKPVGLFAPYACTFPVAILSDRRPLKEREYPF